MRGTHLTRATQEIDFIIGKNYLITSRFENISPLHAFAKAFEMDAVLGNVNSHLHGGHLFGALTRNLYRTLIAECDVIRGRLFEIEDSLFIGKEMKMVAEISALGKTIYDFRQALVPHEEMLASIEAPLERMLGPTASAAQLGQ